VSLAINTSEVISLVGSSGAGKSTLLQILGTLDQADEGALQFYDIDVLGLNAKEQAYFRNQFMGFVFQFHHLLPEFSALENVCMPGWIAGNPTQAVQTEANQILAQLGLADRIHHKPSQLSGGEQQRVAVARALINSPLLILADEPTGNLDSTNSHELFEVIRQLAAEREVSFIIATHDLSLADKTDRCYRMKDGVLIDQVGGGGNKT